MSFVLMIVGFCLIGAAAWMTGKAKALVDKGAKGAREGIHRTAEKIVEKTEMKG